ncbi:unnamed protein product [Urochloa humidicola]
MLADGGLDPGGVLLPNHLLHAAPLHRWRKRSMCAQAEEAGPVRPCGGGGQRELGELAGAGAGAPGRRKRGRCMVSPEEEAACEATFWMAAPRCPLMSRRLVARRRSKRPSLVSLSTSSRSYSAGVAPHATVSGASGMCAAAGAASSSAAASSLPLPLPLLSARALCSARLGGRRWAGGRTVDRVSVGPTICGRRGHGEAEPSRGGYEELPFY